MKMARRRPGEDAEAARVRGGGVRCSNRVCPCSRGWGQPARGERPASSRQMKGVGAVGAGRVDAGGVAPPRRPAICGCSGCSSLAAGVLEISPRGLKSNNDSNDPCGDEVEKVTSLFVPWNAKNFQASLLVAVLFVLFGWANGVKQNQHHQSNKRASYDVGVSHYPTQSSPCLFIAQVRGNAITHTRALQCLSCRSIRLSLAHVATAGCCGRQPRLRSCSAPAARPLLPGPCRGCCCSVMVVAPAAGP